MSNAPPWKISMIGGVAITAGGALVIVTWTLPQLAAFVAMLFIARGVLHIVTTSFHGMPGALSALLGLGELSAGLVLLVWPSPTPLVIVVVIGVWAIVRAVTLLVNILVTRRDRPRWQVLLVPAMLEIALGVTLFARASGGVGDIALILGVLMILEGLTELVLAIDAKRHGATTSAVLLPS